MIKEKIAIAIDKGLLNQIDSLVDGFKLKSRSQAISFFLQKGLREQSIKKAVILLHKGHHKLALSIHNNESLLSKQLNFFLKAGIKEVFILTQNSDLLSNLKDVASNVNILTQFILKNTNSTGDSLYELKEFLCHDNFILMSGDTFNNFDLSRMIIKHFDSEKIATMGLINKEHIKNHGVVLLDGTLIIEFEEKPKKPKSHIINAGIYIFRPEIFELIDRKTKSLEKEVFPKLSKIKQLHGYFTHGEYLHSD